MNFLHSIAIIDPRNEPAWNRFVQSHPFGSVFHLSRWADVLCRTFGYEPYYVALEENGRIRAALPLMAIRSWITGRRLISLPRTSYCDPLTLAPEDLRLLLEFCIQLLAKERLSFLEIKVQNNDAIFHGASLKAYGHFHNQVLPLEPGLKKLWKKFDRSCIRQKISRAQTDGVKIRVGDSIEDVRIFHALHQITTRKHMVPPRPLVFFENIWNALGKQGHALWLIAEIDARPVAAGLFLKSRRTMIFEFLGLDPGYLHHSPGHLLVWEAMRIAEIEGMELFDFGLTPPDNVGLLNFKKRWGTEDRILNYYYYPDVSGYKGFVASGNGARQQDPTRLGTFLQLAKRAAATRLYRHFG